jgi:hypothetical protein
VTRRSAVAGAVEVSCFGLRLMITLFSYKLLQKIYYVVNTFAKIDQLARASVGS